MTDTGGGGLEDRWMNTSKSWWGLIDEEKLWATNKFRLNIHKMYVGGMERKDVAKVVEETTENPEEFDTKVWETPVGFLKRDK